MFPDAINIEDIPLTLDVTESPNVIGAIGDDSFKYTLEMLLRDRIASQRRKYIRVHKICR